MFRLFLTPGNRNLTTDALSEARHHLLDARGTLSLLNPIGLPTSTLQADLQNLNEFVALWINMLPVEIESRQQAENSEE